MGGKAEPATALKSAGAPVLASAEASIDDLLHFHRV
jgi:hypothetical protein